MDAFSLVCSWTGPVDVLLASMIVLQPMIVPLVILCLGGWLACQDRSMARPDSTSSVKSCILNSRHVQIIAAEWNMIEDMNEEVHVI